MPLAVPYFHQTTADTCGPAVLQMVLAFYNKKVTQPQLGTLAGTNRHGTRRRAMIDVVRKHGLYVHAHNGGSLDELTWCVAHGSPVIVNYREVAEDEGHYAVVIGTAADALIFNDPEQTHGPGFVLPRDEFYARWHGLHRTVHRQWLLAVSDTPFSDQLPCPLKTSVT